MFCTYPGCNNRSKKFDAVQAKKHVWDTHLKQTQDTYTLEDPEVCNLILSFLKEDKKEPLYCTWKDCGFVQGERDYWKAKRHVWDRHLRESLYSKLLSKDGPSPNYGSLSAEDKKKVNPDLEVFISTRKKEDVYVPKVEKPLPPPPIERKVLPTRKRERDDCGVLEWNPEKVPNLDIIHFLNSCCKQVEFQELNLQAVYQIIHQQDYDLEKAKKHIEQNLDKVQKQKTDSIEFDCLKNNLQRVTTDPKTMSSLTKKTYQYVYEFLKERRDNYALQ